MEIKQRKKIIVLGSTGSIGLQTLEIVRAQPNLFSVAALSCHADVTTLRRQIAEFVPDAYCVTGPVEGMTLTPDQRSARSFHGPESLLRMIRETPADIVVNGISGSAGLLPSLAALESKKTLALANKETIVMAGLLVMEAAARNGVQVIPVDSEHSAIFQLLGRERRPVLDEIILTASGGAFRDIKPEALANVKLDDALQHPNWKMGEKITVDSATMANKALEIIEAHHLFDLPVDRIKVVIHPQSYVHSLIRTVDGSLYAQISLPDMRLPILNALSYPVMAKSAYARLELAGTTLEFRPVDRRRYPLFFCGCDAARAGGAFPIVFNAANEIAVAAFLKQKIDFCGIFRIVSETMQREFPSLNSNLDGVIFIDALARRAASELIERMR